MDEWLNERGLYRKNTALDGTCLFRAVAERLLPANSISGHIVLRKLCVDYLRKHQTEFEKKVCVDFDEYLTNLASPKGWGTVLELEVISRLFRIDFLAYFGPDPPLQMTDNNFKKKHMLCVTGTCFYDAVYTKTHIQNLGFCQSVVYKILYETIFKLTDLDYAVSKMLHDKGARAQRERYLAQQQLGGGDSTYDSYVSDFGTIVNVREVIESGAILFPYKVAKALDPDIYRNVEFDNWVETQRGKPLLPHCSCFLEVSRRNNFWFLSGGPLRVGVKCQVRLQGRIFTGYIHELSPDRGPAVVYVEEFAQKMTVAYDDLITLPRSALKPDWSYSHKHQMISRLGPRSVKDVPVDQRVTKLRGRRSDLEPADLSSSPTIITDPDSTVSSQASSSTPINHSLIYTQSDLITKWSIVNKNVQVSISDDFSDLPLNDLPTLRFFYNMGIEYFHKGTYVSDQPKNLDDGESPLIVPMCLQPSYSVAADPSNLMMSTPPPVISGPPPTITVCPSSPMITCSSMPLHASTPVAVHPLSDYFSAPLQEPEISSARVEMTPGNREGKDRGRFKSIKPPRFQRLEFAKAAQRCENYGEELQNPEITSTSMESSQLPVTVVPPYQVANFVIEPENMDQMGYMDAIPYQEYQTIVPIMDQQVFLEAESNNYPFYMLPHVPVYF